MQGKEEVVNMDYTEEWNELPKHERKKRLKELRREQDHKNVLLKKMRNWGIVIIVFIMGVIGFIQLTKKTPEQIQFEQEVKAVSLEGKVEEFPIEGRDHVPAGTDVEYKTNPPTSGSHLAEAEKWGIFSNEIDDMAAVHSMEHGGIWISYKDITQEEISSLEEVSKQNSQSTVVSPRSGNDGKIVIASWGKMVKLETAEKALIQKYIDTYKNQAPEKLAR